ncbi:MAG TPA: ComEC/Rec2 family competence protein [Parasegetibacter sp.]
MVNNFYPALKKTPFLRLLIPLIAGIKLQSLINLDAWIPIVLAGTACTILLILNFLKQSWLYVSGWTGGLAIHLLMAALGIWLMQLQNHHKRANHLLNLYQQDDWVVIMLEEDLIEKPKSYKATAQVRFLAKNNRDDTNRERSLIPSTGNLIIYFEKDSFHVFNKYGRVLLIKKPLQRISSPGNPGAFDFATWCGRQNLYHQVFLNKNDYLVVSDFEGRSWKQYLFQLRDRIITLLRKYVRDPHAAGVAEALLIGYRFHLDKELTDAYSNTGVVHIIAISGLHLGMIYGIFVTIFNLLSPSFLTRILKTVVIIVTLWLFSLLAGAAPSILRAAVMFSFISLGECLGRRSNIFNNLAASAFLLLCYDPWAIWDAGFQLSYAAVISIVVFMKPIQGLLCIDNKLMDGLWKLNAVTLSAQILTLPLILFHFHQFPMLFMITNMVAVPLSGIILYLELLLCIFAPISFLAELTGTVTNFLLCYLNKFICAIDSWKWAVADGISINSIQCFLLYGGIIFAAVWIMQKKVFAFIGLLVTVLIFIGIRSLDFISALKRNEIIFYYAPPYCAIDIFKGRNCVWAGELSVPQKTLSFHTGASHILYRALKRNSLEGVIINENFILAGEKKILIINEGYDNRSGFDWPDRIPAGISVPLPAEIDVMLISKKSPPAPEKLLKYLKPKIVVLDVKVGRGAQEKWREYSFREGITLHNMSARGAFVMNLN